MKPELVCTIDSDGTKRWHLNGKLHREDGPAIEWPDGAKSWFINGQHHRIDGPAIETLNGYNKWWYLNDVLYSEQEYYRELVKQKIKTPEEVFLMML